MEVDLRLRLRKFTSTAKATANSGAADRRAWAGAGVHQWLWIENIMEMKNVLLSFLLDKINQQSVHGHKPPTIRRKVNNIIF